MTEPAAPEAPRPQPNQRSIPLPLHRVWVTYALLAAVGVVFLAQLVVAPFEGDVDPIINWGAKVNDLIVAGQLWRLITPIFIHASLTHFLFNAYALFVFGRTIEATYGALRLLVLFFFAGLGGTVASLWLNASASVGASGAIFGLFAAEAVLLWRNRRLLGKVANRQLQELLVLAGVNLFIALVPGSRIDLSGHIGGTLAGALMALWIGPIWQVGPSEVVFGQLEARDTQPFSLRRGFGVVVLFGGLLALTGAYIALAWLQPGALPGILG